MLEFLQHNELGLAFDCLVDRDGDLAPPLSLWQHLDRAAREMRLYNDALKEPPHGRRPLPPSSRRRVRAEPAPPTRRTFPIERQTGSLLLASAGNARREPSA
ncbi:hypothetical protein OG436_39625 (plasmid) [Streptomyces caniferus]